MIIDEILELALDLRIDPTPPPEANRRRVGYSVSYAGYLLDLIEGAVGVTASGTIGERLEAARQAAAEQLQSEYAA